MFSRSRCEGSTRLSEGGITPTYLYLYWRHKKTGAIYAVRVNDAGVLDGAVGSIPPNEATRAKLRQWSYDPKKAEQFRRRFLEFERVR